MLRPLRQADVAEDYEAVMSSADMLRRWSQSSWPSDEFTPEDNRKDLERHEREHAAREAFTFTVLDLGRARCLGCVYLAPPGPALYQAEAQRLREILSARGLDLELEHTGSTAIRGLAAKPVLDILGGRRGDDDRAAVIAAIEHAGYVHRGEQGIEGRDFFRRG